MRIVSVSVLVNQPLNVSKEDAVAGDLTVMLSAAIFVYTPLFCRLVFGVSFCFWV